MEVGNIQMKLVRKYNRSLAGDILIINSKHKLTKT